MDQTKVMLPVIINGQSALKQELLREIKKVDGKVNNLDRKVESLRAEMKQGFEKLTARVDKIGLQVARLEDDTPTRDEFDDVDSRLKKLEQNQCGNFSDFRLFITQSFPTKVLIFLNLDNYRNL